MTLPKLEIFACSQIGNVAYSAHVDHCAEAIEGVLEALS